MANIGKSRTARLAQERLEAIKKFLPVRDSVRDKLQAQQQARVEFATSAEELFKPVTTPTEKAATDTKEALTGEAGILPTLTRTAADTEKIARRTKQTKEILQTLPGDIQRKQEEVETVRRFGEIDILDAETPRRLVKTPAMKKENVELIAKFKEGFVEDIRNTKKEELPEKILISMFNKSQVLKPDYEKINDDNFIKWIYRVYTNKRQVRDDDLEYRGLLKAVKKNMTNM